LEDVSKGLAISHGRKIGAETPGSAVSLLFAAGRRPGAEAIRRIAEAQAGFSISLDPASHGKGDQAVSAEPGQVWLELLTNGLTFDLMGLAPGVPAEPSPCIHAYALAANADAAGLETLTIRPGPHLTGGHGMMPIVRSLAWLAATLSRIAGVEAIAWHPARSWCGPEFFRQGVLTWIEGGVFPGLGLTALAVTPDGGIQSEGLSLFAGQDLRIEPELALDKADAAKIGLRLIDYMVAAGRIDAPQRIKGHDGRALRLEPSANGRFVRVWRG